MQCQFLYINKTKLKPQATVQKSEIKIKFLWFQICERHLTCSSFIICKALGIYEMKAT